MAVTKIKPIKSTLSKALDYIQNPDKTDGKTLVSSFGAAMKRQILSLNILCRRLGRKGTTSPFI